MTNRSMVVGAVIFGVASMGCSAIGMTAAPSDPSERTHLAAESCTKEVWYPLTDTGFALLGAVNLGIAASAAPGDVSWYGAEMDYEAGAALGAAQLAIFGASAVYGWIQKSRCDTLRKERNLDDTADTKRGDDDDKTPPPRFGTSPDGTHAEPLLNDEARTDDHLFEYD